ncbi:hypothetical protein [Dictyobacter aurantiacus]|uniref:DUF4126 domain-containing protein n=1 Tax=Dictyobacter aurantiacus TaxID=1936993 RepID=A0A401ZAU0_9CHLR|nr:hypothetical protein [Dictyobacter aurantiacus]GCE03908.1 hypothetical protein KDAU_12370 [Dictyobacter aurantiacus]
MTAIHKENNKTHIEFPSITFTRPATSSIAVEDINKASWLGIAAGLRSMTPIAVLTATSGESSSTFKTVTTFLAVGEAIGDKLPVIPSRISKGPFLGRIVIGALSGAVLNKRIGQPPLMGAMRGALGAALGTVAGYTIRTFAPNTTGIPDIIWALAEDGVALTLAIKATEPQRQL